ncbi:MAG TPA: MbnP family copper-binding protein [Polyangiaceae bacterium]|nr:MbnP family copper-binding protein [Polyangiaceae bacterium]
MPSLALRATLCVAVPLVLSLACSDDEKSPQNAAGTGGAAGASGASGSANGGGGQGGKGGATADAGSTCETLATICAETDPGTGNVHDCYLKGKAGDESACTANLTKCTAACGGALCGRLGAFCHGLAESGPVQDCHALGHSGDANQCFAEGERCLALCRAARGDAGAGDAGHGGQTDAGTMPVTIRFKAKVGSAAFACGTDYENQGATGTQATPRSLRFYVDELALINDHDEVVPVTMDDRSPWQTPDVALIDFSDATGLCGQQTAEVNSVITGRVPMGTYTGIVFSNGVPEALNHVDPSSAPAPLQAGLSWGWLFGNIFLQAELQSTAPAPDGGAPGLALLHLGSTGCDNTVSDAGPDYGAPPTVACKNQNRNHIELHGFDPTTNYVVFDLAKLFASADLTVDGQCHSDGPYCTPWFAAAGVDFTTGAALATQSIYSVE